MVYQRDQKVRLASIWNRLNADRIGPRSRLLLRSLLRSCILRSLHNHEPTGQAFRQAWV